ncbi:MAG: ParB/RepB/Spo0J family partition protein [Thermaerobacter sp.]|nr:chromosome partitioning protein ParB [Bacillota bacterium]REJ36966.1 MAG: chromosome partitioning protein ParB [Bacillota bacterium]
MSRERKRLGKGLEAILGPAVQSGERVQNIPVDAVRPNPHQPRRNFDQEALEELAASIRSHGVVQPVVVVPAGDGYVLVAGERRWRAARLAGLAEVPALVRDLDPRTMTEVALVENLQREDLTPIEEAYAYQALQEEFGLTQEEIAQRVGKSRSQVANTLRLLALDPEVQALVDSGRLSFGHAKVLLSVASAAEQRRLARRVLEQGWTVRALEAHLGARSGRGEGRRTPAGTEPAVDPHWAGAARELQQALGTPVEIQVRRGRPGGRIVIQFFSQDEFERLYEALAAAGRSRSS